MRRHTVLSSWLPRFARFLKGGGTATTLHYGIMQTLLLHGMPPTPAAMTGALTGAVVNYRLQRDMVFLNYWLFKRYVFS